MLINRCDTQDDARHEVTMDEVTNQNDVLLYHAQDACTSASHPVDHAKAHHARPVPRSSTRTLPAAAPLSRACTSRHATETVSSRRTMASGFSTRMVARGTGCALAERMSRARTLHDCMLPLVIPQLRSECWDPSCGSYCQYRRKALYRTSQHAHSARAWQDYRSVFMSTGFMSA